MRFQLVRALTIGAVITIAAASTAHADDAPSSTAPSSDMSYTADTVAVNDPVPAGANLTPSEDQARVVAITHVRTTGTSTGGGGPVLNSVGDDPSGSLRKCRWAKVTSYGVNITGDYTWRYSTRVDWCYLNGKVVSISPGQVEGYVYGWASALGWTYEGVKSNAQWDYYGDKRLYRTVTQGAFKFCTVVRAFCVQSKYPTHTIDAWGNGTYGWRASQ